MSVMPQWNECGIYDEKCRNRTCDHPTNPKNQGPQCRTMASQRPCGMHVCTRPECQGSKPGTNIGSTGSQSVPQSQGDTEPTYTLTGLSVRDVDRIEQALRMLRRTFTRDSAGYAEISDLGARIVEQTDH